MQRNFVAASAVSTALIFGILVPTAAPSQAAAPPTFDTSPATGATIVNSQPVRGTTTLPLDPNTTLDAVMQQTWAAGRAEISSITSPTGWSLDYQVGNAWQNTMPADTTTVSGVKASKNGLLTGPAAGLGHQTSATVTSSQIVADAASINASGRGDGWDVFLTPKYILNVYHHDWQYRLECHDRSTGELCNDNGNTDLYTVSNVYTSNGSSGTYYKGKVYSFVSYNNDAAVICTNVATYPFSPCGITNFGTGTGDPQSQMSTQVFDGTKIFVADFGVNSILCYNVATEASCGVTALTGLGSGGRQIPGLFVKIGTRLYLNANQIYCWEIGGQSCSGTWPVARSSQYTDSNVIPSFDPVTRERNGICTFSGTVECWDLNGNSVQVPVGFAALTDPNSAATRFSGGREYYQTTAFYGTKIYWASNQNGYDWSEGRVTCYDWETDAACSNFDTSISVGNMRYAFTVDQSRPSCIWTNGDDGSISNFDANTGQLGCPVVQVRGISKFDGLPRYGCSPVSGIIQSFSGVTLTGPNTFDETVLRVTVLGQDGLPVPGFENLQPDSSGFIDLSGLSSGDTGADVTLILDADGFTSDIVAAIETQLVYNVEAVQLCINLNSFRVVCPGSLEGLTSISQTDFAITSSANFSVGGTVQQQQVSNKSYSFNSLPVSRCYIWRGFLSSDGAGLDTTANRAHAEVIAFGPDGKMYVGGTFSNAGGEEAADNLAVWDGQKWSAVGPVPILDSQSQPVLDGEGNPTFSAAVAGRVSGLAFTPNGDLIVGGTFSNGGGVDAADYLAIYNPTTKVWSASQHSFDSDVRAVDVNPANGLVCAGGRFSGKVICLDSKTGYAEQTLGAGLNGNVLSVKFSPDGTLYAGGQFTVSSKSYFAKWNGTEWQPGSADPNFSSYVNDYVWDMAFKDSKMYIVGYFNGVAVLDSLTDTFSWLSGTRALNGSSRGVAVAESGDVYVAGAFSTAGTAGVSNAAVFNGSSWVAFTDGNTNSYRLSATRGSMYDWSGSWDIAVRGDNAIFAGDFEDAATRTGYSWIANFGRSQVEIAPLHRQTRNNSSSYSIPNQTVLKKVKTAKILGFTPDKANVTKKQKLSLRKFLGELAPGAVLECTGLAASDTVNKVALGVAKKRAVNICELAWEMVPELNLVIKKATGFGVKQKYRSVELKLTY